ncbi:MAG: hypothetical protein BWY74_00018 [Firmicutes bacterium ADurb.Bin419]|nr:MAG: hypothetical protein BWY74_00018 [Firmicutes bacterium ADurb.Bin419]
MFFWRKKSKTNLVELEKVVLNKAESIYYDYSEFRKKKDMYVINTVVKNIPLQLNDDGKLFVKVKYVGVPNVIVYFFINISNIQTEYVSKNKTVDLNINATVKNGKCSSKIELLPVYNPGALVLSAGPTVNFI